MSEPMTTGIPTRSERGPNGPAPKAQEWEG